MLETNGYQQFVTFDIDGFEQVTKQLDRQTNLPVYRGFMGKNNGPWYIPALFTISLIVLGVHLIPLGILAIKMAFPAPQVWRSLPPTLDDLVKTIKVCYSLLFSLLVLSLNK